MANTRNKVAIVFDGVVCRRNALARAGVFLRMVRTPCIPYPSWHDGEGCIPKLISNYFHVDYLVRMC
ncbi:MAG: hypothetical protein FWH14_01945 [Oscillospiraceae bacterium]|nr:hypothetical protein [Oscillospiraceae bacterium]